ncbi:hypothetical protein QEZ54_31015 [Catellatospora sp. KI3]|uniref:hypothetical protein n=1 Tax=Catellatospora sp. KI3 TaxID=3041620 RepID=UPI0024831AE7|nr:hypothetical protein [Catellatospora sp. KI3]MDI1465409.1 hypothetical protein [Catellatospora sp. KI3]
MRSILRRWATRSSLLALAAAALVLPSAAPAQAAWGTTLPLTLQIRHYWPVGGSVQIGWVEGTVQFDDGGSALRYSLTFCRQSSYILPYMTINVNSYWAGGKKYATYVTTVYPNYTTTSSSQPCYSSTGTAAGEFTSADFSNVEFIAYGSTFAGQSHVVESQDRIYTNPY